jgi:hypothetical protein
MPSTSNTYLCFSTDENWTIDSEDELSPAISRFSNWIKPSIVIKKPTNRINLDQKDSKWDENTNYDSSASESDEENQGITEEQSKMSERDYMLLTQKVFYLVQETKNSKHKGFLSPILLRNKMYEFLSARSLPSTDDLLFEECDFAISPQIRSYPDTMKRKKFISESLRVKRTKSYLAKSNQAFTSLFDYLTQMNW